MTEPKTDTLYTLKEAAPQLHYAVSTLRDKIRQGKIKAVQDGPAGRVMLASSEIKRFIDAMAEAERAEPPAQQPAPEFQAIDKTRATQVSRPASATVTEKLPLREHYDIGGL